MSNEESGEPVVIDECRRCGGKQVTGLRTYWEGGWEFKCDVCGRKMLLGYDEQTTSTQVDGKRGRERANENRDRYFRELEAKYEHDVEEAKEQLESEPDIIESFSPLFEPISFHERDTRRFGRTGLFDSEEKSFSIPD